MFKVTFLEEIYSVLTKYANVSTEYYDKEGFIFLFGVICHTKTPRSHVLNCTDDKERILYIKDKMLMMKGDGDDRVNSIIRKIVKMYENGPIRLEQFN